MNRISKPIIAFLAILLCIPIFVSGNINKSTSSITPLQDISRLAYYQSQERDSIITDSLYIKKLLILAQKNNDKTSQLRCKIALAVIARENGEIKTAFRLIEEVIKTAQEAQNTPMLMVGSNNYGIVCRRVDRLTDATKYHMQSLKMADLHTQNNDWLTMKSKCVALNGLGNISLSMAQYNNAMQYFTEAIGIEKRLDSKIGMAINHANIGTILEILGNTDSALYHYLRALDLNTLGKSPKGVAICQVSIGDILVHQKKYIRAALHFQKAISITDSIGDIYHWLGANQSFMQLLLVQNQYEKAQKMAFEAINKAHKAGIVFYLSGAYMVLANIYEKQKDLGKSIEYLKLSYAYKDSMNKESNLNNIQDLQIKYETEKKEQQIVWLEAQEKNHQLVRKFLILLITLLLILVAALWALARFRRKNVIQKELLLAREQQINKMIHEKLSAELDYKNRELASLASQLAAKSEALYKLKISLADKEYPLAISQINNELNMEKDWEVFYLQFEKVHPNFFRQLRSTYPDITPKDERLCAYLCINMTTKEIAQILNVTVAAVDKSRNRLRKKLTLDPDTNLSEFMCKLN